MLHLPCITGVLKLWSDNIVINNINFSMALNPYSSQSFTFQRYNILS